MPITQEEFEIGAMYDVLKCMKRLYEHLKAHPELAFTTDELQESLPAGVPVEAALFKLIQLGAAQTGWVSGALYYTLGPKPLEP